MTPDLFPASMSARYLARCRFASIRPLRHASGPFSYRLCPHQVVRVPMDRCTGQHGAAIRRVLGVLTALDGAQS